MKTTIKLFSLFSLTLCASLCGMDANSDVQKSQALDTLRRLAQEKFAGVELANPIKVESCKIDDYAEHAKQTNLIDEKGWKRSADESMLIGSSEKYGEISMRKKSGRTVEIHHGTYIRPLIACLSNNNKLVAIATTDHRLTVIKIGASIVDPKRVGRLEGAGSVDSITDTVLDCCFSPDSRHLAVTRSISPAILYCTKTWLPTRMFKLSEVNDLARFPYFCAPDQMRLTASRDGIHATFKLPKEKASQDNAE